MGSNATLEPLVIEDTQFGEAKTVRVNDQEGPEDACFCICSCIDKTARSGNSSATSGAMAESK